MLMFFKQLFTIFGFILLLPFFSDAQNIAIKEEQGITSMLYRMVEINRNNENVSGWRIQIIATTDRREMDEEKIKFQFSYPDVKVNWEHSKPFYKLRVGAFATRLEAVRLLYRIKQDYPGAYPIKDNLIPARELVGL